MYNTYQGKTVLVTGGTGFFGKNFVTFLLTKTKAKKVIVFSRDEFKQHYMAQELPDKRVRFFLGDVRDLPRLQRAFKGVDIVVHAAALKQIPILEYNPSEAVKTNVEGTQNVIDAAIDQGVPRALLISSDKAAQPINLYGATKLCAEKLFVSANAYAPGKTHFSAVRYGNVVGSRGSIIEVLLKNRAAPIVHLTDPEMTRFWITLAESFELVTFALKNMEGGEIFIPKLPSMKITDLFDTIVPNAKRKVIGIRPGEKVHEDLITTHEARRSIRLDKYFVLLPDSHPWSYKNPYAKYSRKGKRLSGNTSISSNTNLSWLTKKKLQKIVRDVEHAIA